MESGGSKGGFRKVRMESVLTPVFPKSLKNLAKARI